MGGWKYYNINEKWKEIRQDYKLCTMPKTYKCHGTLHNTSQVNKLEAWLVTSVLESQSHMWKQTTNGVSMISSQMRMIQQV